MTTPDTMDPGIKAAVEAVGSIRALARAIGISHVSILKWNTIPIAHLFQIEELTQIPRERLRPDIFLMPRPKRKKTKT
jgi:hypothetical protein